MPLEAHCGTFLKPSTGAPFTQAITGLGFSPAAILFWSSNLNTDATFTPDLYFSFGFCDDAGNENCFATFSNDNAATSDTGCAIRSDAIMACGSGGSTEWRGSVTTIGADGFTFTWHENNADTAYINYLALGGDGIVNSHVSTFNFTTAGGAQTVTGVGFTPNFVMMFTTPNTSNDTTNASASWGLGCAKSATEEWAISARSQDNQGTSATSRYQITDGCLTRIATAGGIDFEIDFTSFGSGQFTFNKSNAPSDVDLVAYLALQLSVAGDVAVGSFNTATATGNQTVTATTTNSNMAAFLTTFNNVSSASEVTNNRVSMGAAHSMTPAGVVSHENNVWSGDTDNEPDTIAVAYHTENDTVICAVEDATAADTTIGARGDITQFGANNYTINWAIKDATAYQVLHIVFAAATEAGGGGGPSTPSAVTGMVMMGEGGYY